MKLNHYISNLSVPLVFEGWHLRVTCIDVSLPSYPRYIITGVDSDFCSWIYIFIHYLWHSPFRAIGPTFTFLTSCCENFCCVILVATPHITLHAIDSLYPIFAAFISRSSNVQSFLLMLLCLLPQVLHPDGASDSGVSLCLKKLTLLCHLDYKLSSLVSPILMLLPNSVQEFHIWAGPIY